MNLIVKNPTRWDLLTYGDILDKYYDLSRQIRPSLNTNQRIAYAIESANNSAVNQKDIVAKWQAENFEQFNNYFGILSLTEHPAEIAMWEKYSKSHTGFCVGFDAKKMFEGFPAAGGPVFYSKELPIIYPAPKHSFLEQSLFQIFYKYDKWEFEKEYRVYILRNRNLLNNERIYCVQPSAIREIILGAEMPKKSQIELIKSLPQELNHVSIRKASFVDGTININQLKN